MAKLPKEITNYGLDLKKNYSYFDEVFLAIICDVGDKERIAQQSYKKARKVLKVDHHPCKVEIASHPILDTESAAAAEIMTDILLKWKGTTLSKEAASYLYIGIVGDSGRFQYSSTNAHTFACASALIETGISIRDI